MTAGWRSEARARCVAARKYGERGEPVTLSTTYDALRALDALDAVLAAVGDEMAIVGGDYDAGWSEGWNACREAVVRAIEGDA